MSYMRHHTIMPTHSFNLDSIQFNAMVLALHEMYRHKLKNVKNYVLVKKENTTKLVCTYTQKKKAENPEDHKIEITWSTKTNRMIH